MKLNITTIAIGLALGYIAYKVMSNKTTENKSNFSSACGCGA